MSATEQTLLPRLCFVGPMVGFNPGHVVTQGVRLSSHFKSAGYPSIAVSASTNRYLRLLDIVATIVRKRRSIDVLIVHVYGGPSFVVEDIASLLGRMFGHRIVMLLHGGALPKFMGSFPRWARRVLRRADVIVAPSPYLARAVAPLGHSCRIIPNVIDLSAYPYRHRGEISPRLFWMRTFDPTYNPHMAIEVLARLRTTHPGATLLMGGQDKGLLAEVRRRVTTLKLDGAVRFPGFLDMAGKIKEGQVSDIFINTSHIDNMPVAVVEACAMGMPVVSTAVGGVPDLLTDGLTGLLVPDGDSEAMAAAIRRLLTDPSLTGSLSENGRRLAERSAWCAVRGQWEALFAGLLARAALS